MCDHSMTLYIIFFVALFFVNCCVGAVIGGVVGGLVLVGVIVVIMIVSCFIWHKMKRKKGASVTENGLLHGPRGTHISRIVKSALSFFFHLSIQAWKDVILKPPRNYMAITVILMDFYQIMNHLHNISDQNEVRLVIYTSVFGFQKVRTCFFPELYVVSYIDPEKTKILVQKLYEWFSDLIPTELPGENGNFNNDLMRIMGEQHRVIILGNIKETSHQNKNARDWISHFNSFPVFTAEKLRYMFLVRFRTNETISGCKLKQIPVLEHPDDSDFNPAEVAKFIYEKIEDVIVSYSQNQPNQHQTSNHLNGQPDGSTSSQSTPHQPEQARLSTSDLGSELSETANETEDVEPQDRTLVTADTEQDTAKTGNESKTTDQTQACLTNRRVSDLKGTTQGSPKPGGLESASGASLKEYFDEKFENLSENLSMAMKKQGEDIKDKVDKKGDEIKAKVEEEGGKLQESIEFVADATEQTRIELQNQKVKVNQPHSDDEDGVGKETGDLGSTPTRQD